MTIISKRETILAYLKATTIPLIDGTGHYNLAPGIISRDFKGLGDMRGLDYPAIFILDDAAVNYVPMTNCGYTVGSGIQSVTDGMTVGIVGYVSVPAEVGRDDDGTLSTEMNKIYSDILIAMLSDISLGGNCLSVVLTHSDHAVNYSKKFEVGQVLCLFSIKYDFNPSASTPVT